MADASKIIKDAEAMFSSSERTNFENLWEQAAKYCRPTGDTIQGVRVPGERKSVSRLIDVGIQSCNTFSAGVSSTLVPKGSKYFTYNMFGAGGAQLSNTVERWLNDCSNIANDYVNESNFYTEFNKTCDDLGLIGTSLMMTEPDDTDAIRFKTYYIDSFAFVEDSKGRVDGIYFKLNFTAKQIINKFGANMPDCITRAAEKPGNDEKFEIMHVIQPRSAELVQLDSVNPEHFKYESVYVLTKTKEILKESGFKRLPGAVGRWKIASNETYGRSPAIEVQSTLAMLNGMERTKLKSAQRIANPQWLIPDGSGVRNLNNNSGGVVKYNAANANAKPEQLIHRESPQLTDQFMKQKESIIQDAFFVSIFNPLVDKQNMTKYEVAQRQAIANQNLIPSIGNVIDSVLAPTFKNIFFVLLEGGHFPTMPKELELSNLQVSFMSRAAMAIDNLEVAAIFQVLESTSMLAQIDPAIVDRINTEEILKLQVKAFAVPTSVIRSDLEVKKIRLSREAAATAEQQKQDINALGDIYSKTTAAAENGSPAQALMAQAGM